MTRFHIKLYAPEAVIFDTASGDTHYLKPLTLALFQTCHKHTGYNSAEITTALATRLGLEDSPHLRVLTEETLASLRKIGLLESA